MTIIILQAPSSLSSKESQTNDFYINNIVKSMKDRVLQVCLFGSADEVQRYISSLYLLLWDYCLLYNKIEADCVVIPLSEACIALYAIIMHTIAPSYFNKEIIETIQEKRISQGASTLQIQFIDCDLFSEEVIALDFETSKAIHFHSACLGGTFDCLHPGHRILLTLASLVCDKLTIGLTSDCMLQSKEKHEYIKPYEERQNTVLEFLHKIAPQLEVKISPLTDIYGPSVVLPELEAIVVSIETLPGAKLINKVRAEHNMAPLKVLTVNRGSKYCLSSSFIRDYFHPFCVFYNKQFTISGSIV